MSTRCMRKLMLSYGLISVPVKVYTGARGLSESFNQIHEKCKSKIRMPRVCQACEEELESADIVKGFEGDDGAIYTVTSEELDGCKPDSGETMEVTACVQQNEVDPMLFESSYYLAPGDGGAKGYAVLASALAATGLYAIAKVVLNGGREDTVVIRPYKGILAFHTMLYADEVNAIPEVDASKIRISQVEQRLCEQLMTAQVGEFDHSYYRDEYRAKVVELKALKQKGKTVKAITRKPPAKTCQDDMAALLQSSVKISKAVNDGTKSRRKAS